MGQLRENYYFKLRNQTRNSLLEDKSEEDFSIRESSWELETQDSGSDSDQVSLNVRHCKHNLQWLVLLPVLKNIKCHHQKNVLPRGMSFTANSGTNAAVLPKDRSSITNSGTKIAVLLGMNRCSNFPLLSAPHSLVSIWTDLQNLKRSQGPQPGGQESGFD